MTRHMKKSLRQEIFCLRKIDRFLSDHSPPQTELLGGSHQEQEDHGKFCRQKLWTYIFSVVHRSLSDPFVPANREMVQI